MQITYLYKYIITELVAVAVDFVGNLESYPYIYEIKRKDVFTNGKEIN